MERENSNRSRTVGVRFTPEEFEKIEQRWKSSTCNKLSDYVRKVLFNKPITTFYRNKSADDTLIELAKLRTELNHIGNNFNQVVKKMHMLDTVPELKRWLSIYDVEKKILLNKIDEIKNHSKKLAEKWLQS